MNIELRENLTFLKQFRDFNHDELQFLLSKILFIKCNYKLQTDIEMLLLDIEIMSNFNNFPIIQKRNTRTSSYSIITVNFCYLKRFVSSFK